jgi:hypothetical protein
MQGVHTGYYIVTKRQRRMSNVGAALGPALDVAREFCFVLKKEIDGL